MAAATSERPNPTPPSTFLPATPDRQTPRDLITCSHVIRACGLRLPPELPVARLDDADAVRVALRRRDREVRS
jgi:hypothetical protein